MTVDQIIVMDGDVNKVIPFVQYQETTLLISIQLIRMMMKLDVIHSMELWLINQ